MPSACPAATARRARLRRYLVPPAATQAQRTTRRWVIASCARRALLARRARKRRLSACLAPSLQARARRRAISVWRARSRRCRTARRARTARPATFVWSARVRPSRARGARTPTGRCSTSEASSAASTSASAAQQARAAPSALLSRGRALPARTLLLRRPSRASSVCRASTRTRRARCRAENAWPAATARRALLPAAVPCGAPLAGDGQCRRDRLRAVPGGLCLRDGLGCAD